MTFGNESGLAMKAWNYCKSRQKLWGRLFLALFGLGVLIDLYLVLVAHTDSISWRIWEACLAHPTLMVAGTLATIGVCRLVSHRWGLVFLAGFLGGHLFTHW